MKIISKKYFFKLNFEFFSNLYYTTLNHAQKLKNNIDIKVEEFGNQFELFGIFGILNYPVYWIIWNIYSIQSYENLYLRLIATFLCLPLIFIKNWPTFLKTWLPIYWYTSITFCLPFFFTFMLFKNHLSSIWLMSATAVLCWLILLVDWLSFIIILIVGSSAGFLVFYGLEKTIPPADYYGIIAQFVGTALVGLIFARNKENIEKTKLQTIFTIGSNIAHELRTPLSSVEAGIGGIKNYLPILIDGYNQAKDHGLDVKFIAPHHYNSLSHVLERIISEIQYSNIIINMLLLKSKPESIEKNNFKNIAIDTCIQEALSRYPFKKQEINLVHYNNHNSFDFKGDSLLMVHVFFNLIKNALYFIASAGKGEIKIWCETRQQENVVFFKDTAQGIPAPLQHKIFNKFNTNTLHGTGLGLAFCKNIINSFEGDIVCRSEYGSFTEFAIHLPKVAEEG